MPFRSTKFQVEDIPDLTGYVVIVTGGNSGIGHETTLQLAVRGARVYIAARSPQRMNRAIDEMKASRKENLDLHALDLDLQNLQSVKEAADGFMRKEKRLDILINNAGIMAVPFKLTNDGFESQWQTNYLAPFYLITCLLPVLKSTAAASASKSRVRIVNVSGEAAFYLGIKEIDFERPNLDYLSGAMQGWKRYAHSKLALFILTRALHNHLSPHGITSYCLHPGIIETNLQAADPSLFGAFIRHIVHWGVLPGSLNVPDGAKTTLCCATWESAVGGSGEWWGPLGKLEEGGKAERWVGKGSEARVEDVWERSWEMIKKVGVER